jgi:hypothetical protein
LGFLEGGWRSDVPPVFSCLLQFHMYYPTRHNTFTVVRVLRDKTDIGAILEKQEIDDPDVD